MDATNRGTVEVLYLCRLGSRLTQYCIGRIIAKVLGFNLRAPPIPGFPTVDALATGVARELRPPQIIGGHRIDLDKIVADRTPRRIVLRGFRSSSNLVLSVSSYAWWAGWLSEATQIFFPVAGFFDQVRARQRPSAWQQDLWVNDEPRYVAIRPVGLTRAWTGTEEERQRLLNS